MGMPSYWMISDRALENGLPGGERGDLSYWISDNGPLDTFANWNSVSANDFKKLLVAAADRFPSIPAGNNEKQSHVTFLVHGYNNGWDDAARLYQKFCDKLYSGPESLGLCVSFDWPSMGSVVDYLPDREHARQCAGDLADILSELYDWLLQKQQATFEDSNAACKAKVSMVAHSMGNYLLQKAMATAWTRKNQPLLVSLINQLVMVAADVDNDLFESNSSDGSDGDAVANLVYRITALYSGRDGVLGVSAGLKHFGVRRLGRSGLAVRPPTDKDNIWDVECSSFFPPLVGSMDIHSAYFSNEGTLSLMHDLLRGIDRSVLDALKRTGGSAWPATNASA
jgi:esterase/lipase superfamily enzyme